METKRKATNRTIYLAQAGHPGYCQCGLKSAYFAVIVCQVRNQHGLLVPRRQERSFCTTHGRAYAAKFHLYIRNSPQGENNATDDTKPKPEC
jgi:hypothetical protein